MQRFFNDIRLALMGILILSCNLLANAQGNYNSNYGYNNNGYNNNNYNGYGNGYNNNYNNGYNNGYGANYQDFYDGLAPYGQWIYDQQYGYVWLPNVGPDFRPYYTNGYWAMTQYGNTWVSNYPWGWAAFHYGRWTFDNYYGWLWIPGSEWAPAWVSWRSNNSYYGWAPMGPGINVNLNLNLIPMDWWVFLSPRYFYQPNFHSYCYNNWANTRNIYYQTSYLHNAYGHHHSSYYTGPRADDYYRSTGHRVSMYDINNNTSVGPTTVRGNRIDMYRPNVGSSNSNNNNPNQPSRFAHLDRSISNTPQNYGDGMQQAVGRQQILNQPNWNNGNRNNTTEPRNGWNGQNNVQQMNQQRIQQQQQENQQALQQQMQMQQQRDQQMQMQRDQQMNQQRMQQQQMQMQQQRDQQMNQQRMQEQQMQMQQQRDQQMQMQRDQQMNQQRMQQQQMQMQQQRDQQMNQQRMQMQQQRYQQMQMQRDQQIQRPQPSEQRQGQDENFRGRGRF